MDQNLDSGYMPDDSNRPPKKQRSPLSIFLRLLAIVGLGFLALCLLLPTVRNSRPAAERNACSNNLKQIAMALQSYADAHHEFPPLYTTDANGKPLHSWRTLILPYFEEGNLFQSIDLTKPWDDPVNAQAAKTKLLAYQCPAADIPDNYTTYLAVATPQSFLQPDQSKATKASHDEAKKIMLIEVDIDHAVPWMSPADASESDIMNLSAHSKLAHPGGIYAAVYGDGHVEFLDLDMPAAERRALIPGADQDKAATEVAK